VRPTRVTTFTVHTDAFGTIRGAATGDGLALVVLPESDWERQLAPLIDGADVHEADDHPAAAQLREYVRGERRTFTCALDWRLVHGDFARAVLARLAEIPFGELVSYGELARAAGRPGAARAVGGAVGRNPLPIVVPCHRVIAADGKLGGFSAGLPNKRWLLRLEGHAVDTDSTNETATRNSAWSRSPVRRAAPKAPPTSA